MILYIDTEFNSFKGALISIALVAQSGQEFYQSMGCASPDPWVAKHVMPVIGIEPMAKTVVQAVLQDFLMQFDSVHIIADWPEDIQHFCELLITGPGQRLNTPPLTMEVRRDLDAESRIPHNALEDARAIRAKHMGVQ